MPNVVVDDSLPSPPPPSDTTIDAHSSMLGEMGAATGTLNTVERQAHIDPRDSLLSAIQLVFIYLLVYTQDMNVYVNLI